MIGRLKRWLKGGRGPGFYGPEKIGGHDLWTWKNPAEMPKIRQMAYMNALKDVELGIQRHDLVAFCDQLTGMTQNREKPQAEKDIEMVQLIGYLKYLLEIPATSKPLLHVASVLVLIDDEPEASMEAKWAEMKWRLIENNDRAHGFFLQVGWSLIDIAKDNMGEWSEWDYTKNKRMEKLEALFLERIGSSEKMSSEHSRQ